MATTIILIRHGQTDWNVEKRYISFTDIALNAGGIEQAKMLGRRLAREKVHSIYSSDSARASAFAEIVFKDRPVEKAAALREMNFGVFEGMTYAGIMKRYPDIYGRWLEDPFGAAIPEGEDPGDFTRRVTDTFARITSLNRGKASAVVTHAGPIKTIVGGILKPRNAWDVMPDLASLTMIEIDERQRRVLLFNDTSYLRNG